ncbi:MAG: AAA family ATPase [Deltaproteobacteria bacterium]|nr:AAA family ATPase [Deltaproteobacteria bacterium]
MEYAIPLFFVLTGGPGGGKTSLIEELKSQGYPCVEESGRQVIKDQLHREGHALPWKDKVAFRDLMISRDKKQYIEALRKKGPVFFDRAVPDSIGYSQLEGLPLPETLYEILRSEFRYQRLVFITPPWKEIYMNDSERKQNFDEAVRTYHTVAEAYRGLDYELVELPKGTVQERVLFLLNKVKEVTGG